MFSLNDHTYAEFKSSFFIYLSSDAPKNRINQVLRVYFDCFLLYQSQASLST